MSMRPFTYAYVATGARFAGAKLETLFGIGMEARRA